VTTAEVETGWRDLRWSTVEESTFTPGPGSVTVVGKPRVRTGKTIASKAQGAGGVVLYLNVAPVTPPIVYGLQERGEAEAVEDLQSQVGDRGAEGAGEGSICRGPAGCRSTGTRVLYGVLVLDSDASTARAKAANACESQKWFVEFTSDSMAWASEGFIREYVSARMTAPGQTLEPGPRRTSPMSTASGWM
jgi:hypothetical protein